jgi:hypothetical protein
VGTRDREETAQRTVSNHRMAHTGYQTAFAVESGAERKNQIEAKVGKSLGKIFDRFCDCEKTLINIA